MPSPLGFESPDEQQRRETATALTRAKTVEPILTEIIPEFLRVCTAATPKLATASPGDVIQDYRDGCRWRWRWIWSDSTGGGSLSAMLFGSDLELSCSEGFAASNIDKLTAVLSERSGLRVSYESRR